MTTLREAAQQALEAWDGGDTEWFKRAYTVMEALRAALAEPVQEPVARECSDPMCACRGGPCAECEEGEREKEIEDLRSSLYFYQRRCEALQSWQSKMRDPERTIVCDILANGKTLDPAFAGDRYTALRATLAEPVQEPVAWVHPTQGHMQRRTETMSPEVVASYGRGGWTPLYAFPPQRKPLTEEEIDSIWDSEKAFADIYAITRAIERAHGIGGNA